MRFVTVATKSSGYYEYLLQSCKRHNVHIDVLGLGMKWGGWVWRMDLIRKYYESLEPDEIVCFIDAYDVIILQDSSVIEKRFLDTGARIVVAEDFNTEPVDEFIARMFMFGTCKNIRINAGTYIGYVSDILWMLNTMCHLHNCDKDVTLDDQKMMTQLCSLVPYRFHIDTDRHIFLCICYRDDMRLAGISVDNQRQLLYKNTMDPCILHGAGKANLDSVIAKLGYDIDVMMTSQTVLWRTMMKQFMISTLAIVGLAVIGLVLFLVFQKQSKSQPLKISSGSKTPYALPHNAS